MSLHNYQEWPEGWVLSFAVWGRNRVGAVLAAFWQRSGTVLEPLWNRCGTVLEYPAFPNGSGTVPERFPNVSSRKRTGPTSMVSHETSCAISDSI